MNEELRKLLSQIEYITQIGKFDETGKTAIFAIVTRKLRELNLEVEGWIENGRHRIS